MKSNYLEALKIDLMNFVILSVAISSVPVAITLHLRTQSEGGTFSPMSLLYPLLMWILVFLKNKLTPEFKAGIFSILNYLTFINGIMTRGILGPAFFFFIMSIIVLAYVLPSRRLILATIFFVIGAILIQIAYFVGLFELKVDVSLIVQNPLSWIAYSAIAMYIVLLIVYAAHRYVITVWGIANELEMANEKLSYHADHDALTSLPNLRMMEIRAEQAIAHAERAEQNLALCFIDLDGFKSVNDTFGHDAGDATLKTVANILETTLRKEDIVARIGGDEFLALLTNDPNSKTVSDICNKLIERISMPNIVNNNHLQVGASIGVAMFPKNGDNLDDLKKSADQAMYVIKKSGKNNFAFSKSV